MYIPLITDIANISQELFIVLPYVLILLLVVVDLLSAINFNRKS